LVKKDTPVGLRPTLKKLLVNFIKSKSDLESKQLFKDIKAEIKALSFKELLITKQISRELSEYTVIPQHVRAMQFSNKYLGTNFSRNNYKGGFLYCKSANFPDQEAIMLEDDMDLPKGFVCDYDKYYDLFVKNKIILFDSKNERYFNQNHSIWEYVQT
jgi:DNA polymerase elongation subunit (family B)